MFSLLVSTETKLACAGALRKQSILLDSRLAAKLGPKATFYLSLKLATTLVTATPKTAHFPAILETRKSLGRLST